MDESVQYSETRGIRAFKLKVHADQRAENSLFPIGDGLPLARKR